MEARFQVWEAREKDLKLLLDRARQGTGGAAISVAAYQGDCVAWQERSVDGNMPPFALSPENKPEAPHPFRSPESKYLLANAAEWHW